MNGIDISSWQPGNITSLVDYDFVLIKATQGTGFVSPTCDAQYQGALARGKKVGVYHFADGGDANAEAQFFVDNCKGYIGQAVLVLDWEAGAIARGASWVRTFVKKVKELTNVPPIIYGSASPLGEKGIPAVAAEENCGLWVAAYPSNDVTGYRQEDQLLGGVIRQYTSKGRLDGYAGNLDLNISTLDGATWDKYAHGQRDGSPAAPAAPAPARKTDDQVAHEVMNGAWGNGDERRSRLAAAGYDYDTVQGLVNNNFKPARLSNEQVADQVIAGQWGNGDDRVNRLRTAGYDAGAVQNAVNAKIPAKKSNDTVAREVIHGDWGNGQDRRNKLAAAGFDYNTIQGLVDRLI